MATPASRVEHPEVRAAIDLLEAWIEAQRVAHQLPASYGVPGELVVFELDAAGRVKRARFGENSSERIETWAERSET